MSAPLADLFIRHPLFDEIVAVVDDVERRTLAGEQLLLPICGPSRVGKTFTVEPLRRRLAPRQIGTRRVMPVLYVKTPARPSLSSLPRAILGAADMGVWAGRGGPEVMTASAIGAVKRLETKVVIVDEFHHFAQPTAKANALDVSDWLKNFFDLTATSGILIGTPPAINVIERDDQLRSRCLAVHHLLPYNWAHGTQRREYEGVIEKLQTALVERGFVLKLPLQFPLRMAVASGVRVGMTVKIMIEACNFARDTRLIDVSVLVRAFKKTINRAIGSMNPFNDVVSDTDARGAFLATMRSSRYSDAFTFAAMAEAGASAKSIEEMTATKRSLDDKKVEEVVGC